MTAAQELNELLAEQVDRFAEVIDQRDRARRCAVALEQENAALEIERDALIAECEGLRREALELRASLAAAVSLTRTGEEG